MAFNPNKCLKFTCVEGGFISCNGYQFSADGGLTWVNNSISASAGTDVYMKGDHYPGSNHVSMNGKWKTTSGSIMSLIDDGAGELLEITANSAFDSFFEGCASLVELHTGLLPAMTLTESCYGGMFTDCSGLTSLPDNFLPATVAAKGCYKYMFQRCTGVKKTGKNFTKIRTYAEKTFNGMFYECTSLEEIAENFFTDVTPEGLDVVYYFCQGCYALKVVHFNFKEWGGFDKSWHSSGLPAGICYAPRELPEIHDSYHYLPYGWVMSPLVPPSKVISVNICGTRPRCGRKV